MRKKLQVPVSPLVEEQKDTATAFRNSQLQSHDPEVRAPAWQGILDRLRGRRNEIEMLHKEDPPAMEAPFLETLRSAVVHYEQQLPEGSELAAAAAAEAERLQTGIEADWVVFGAMHDLDCVQ